MKTLTPEEFLADVSGHSMAVFLDQGVYRHLRFRTAKESWNMWFEIVTWPGSLAINGDMGSWSFSRVEDMFTFFRSGIRDGELKTNPHYWAEKITSESRFGGPSEKFHPEIFKASVLKSLEGYGLIEADKARVIEELQSEAFNEEDESTARRAVSDFECYLPSQKFTLVDTWELNGKAYTYHYLWCLHAILWGIQQFDLAASRMEVA